MGLFSKKEPCPFCGGKVKGLFVNKIEGRHICYDCYGVADLPRDVLDNITLDGFRSYMAFRAENDKLKPQFQITQKVDFGWFDSKFVFDFNNRLMCMDDSLNKTVFEGKQIKSFVIKEDNTPLFEGSASGLMRHSSSVPDAVRSLSTQIQIFRMRKELHLQTDDDSNTPCIDLPEPFEQFNVEIRFEHPYWDVFKADMGGPRFDNSMPDINDYLERYREHVAEMEQLARAIMRVAFPDAPEQSGQGSGAVTAPAAPVDAVAEIKRYKDLLEQGAITEEEFTAKKKQLLGI